MNPGGAGVPARRTATHPPLRWGYRRGKPTIRSATMAGSAIFSFGFDHAARSWIDWRIHDRSRSGLIHRPFLILECCGPRCKPRRAGCSRMPGIGAAFLRSSAALPPGTFRPRTRGSSGRPRVHHVACALSPLARKQHLV